MNGRTLEECLRGINFFKYPGSPYLHARLIDFSGKRISISTKQRSEKLARSALLLIIREKFFDLKLSDLLHEKSQIATFTERSLGTVKCDQQALFHLMNLIGDLPIQSITSLMAKRFMREHVDKNGNCIGWQSVESPKKHKRQLHRIWNDLIAEGRLNSKNIWAFKVTPSVQKYKYAPTVEELERVLLMISENTSISKAFLSNVTLLQLVTVYAGTGIRASEAIAIKTKWVNFEKRTLEVWNDENFKIKDYYVRSIPLSDEVVTVFAQQIAVNQSRFKRKWLPDDFIFVDCNQKALSYDLVYSNFTKHSKQIHKNFDLHCLRRYYARRVYSTAENKMTALTFLREVLGHSSLIVTIDYLGMVDNALVEIKRVLGWQR